MSNRQGVASSVIAASAVAILFAIAKPAHPSESCLIKDAYFTRSKLWRCGEPPERWHPLHFAKDERVYIASERFLLLEADSLLLPGGKGYKSVK